MRNDTEELIELTAGVCKQLLMQNCSFEVWINSVKDNGLLHIKNGDNRKHLQNVLKVLASISDRGYTCIFFLFYTAGFRRKELDAVPLILGTSQGNTPERINGS